MTLQISCVYTGRYDDLTKVVNECLKHNEEDSSVHFNYASALGKAGHYQESEKHFLFAIKYGGNIASYHSNLGNYIYIYIYIYKYIYYIIYFSFSFSLSLSLLLISLQFQLATPGHAHLWSQY